MKARAAATPKPTTAFRAANRGPDGKTDTERAISAEVAELRKLGVRRLLTDDPASRRHRPPAHAPKPWSLAVGRNLSGGHRRFLEDGDPPDEPSAGEKAENVADDRTVDVLLGIIRASYPDYPEDSLLGLPRHVLEEWVSDIESRRDQAGEEFEAAVAAAEAALPRGISKALAAKRTVQEREQARTAAEIRAASFDDGAPHPYARGLALKLARESKTPPRSPRKFDPAIPLRPYSRALEARREEAA